MDPIRDSTNALLELAESLTRTSPGSLLLHRVAAQVLQILPGAGGVTGTLSEAGHVGTVLSCPLFVPADNPVAHRQANGQRLSGALNIWSSNPPRSTRWRPR